MNAMQKNIKIIEDLEKEYPEIKPNHYKFKYIGDKDWFMDLVQEQPNPEDDWIDNLDNPNKLPPPPKPNYLMKATETILNKKDLKILEWVLYEGKSYAYVARQIGCTRQNIKYHYERIIKKLKKEITCQPK
jgi:DNA-directed RNA polymerase specialized sigma subunit